MKIAVLITCYNRRETTLRCLRLLAGQLREGDDVFLVDDGCTDGTAEVVHQEFPGVHVIFSGGGFYWAKGMALAWQSAVDAERENGGCDGYLWLNDDVELYEDALSNLRSHMSEYPDSVIVGELINSGGEIVYGIRGDLFTGNFVWVPRGVYKKVGLIEGRFWHAWADSDYALRCKRAGVSVVGIGVIGMCEGHLNRPPLKGLSLRERWALLWDPKGWCLHDLWLYRRRNWGFCAALVSALHFVLHVLAGERA